jgi:hypothetical protein
MNVGIARTTSPFTKIGGKPPLHPRPSYEKRIEIDSCSSQSFISESISSKLPGLINKSKNAFQYNTFDSNLGIKNIDEKELTSTPTKKYTNIENKGRSEKGLSENRKDRNVSSANRQESIVSNTHPKVVAPTGQRAPKKEGRHRRAKNIDFMNIFPNLQLPPLSAPVTLLLPSQKVDDYPSIILSCSEAATLRKELDNAISTYQRKDYRQRRLPGGSMESWQHPPRLLSVEQCLEASLVQRFHSAIQYFWALLTTRSSCISKTLKENLKGVNQNTLNDMVEGLANIRAKHLRREKEAAHINGEAVREWFTPLYENVLKDLGCMIGILQVFKRNKEPVGAIPQHGGVGVLWAYQHHSEHQNNHLNVVMIQWLYQNWERATVLEESELVRIAVDEDLSSVAIYEWWNHALKMVWEPVAGTDLIPIHNLHGRRKQRRRKHEKYLGMY